MKQKIDDITTSRVRLGQDHEDGQRAEELEVNMIRRGLHSIFANIGRK